MTLCPVCRWSPEFCDVARCQHCHSPVDKCPQHRRMRMAGMSAVEAHQASTYLQELRDRVGEGASPAANDQSMRLQRMGVPAETVLALRRRRDTVVTDAAKRFIDAESGVAPVLLLVGRHGAGKSVAAAMVMEDFARRFDYNGQPGGGVAREPAQWVYGRDISARQSYGQVDSEWLDGLITCRLLVVDDLGAEATEQGKDAMRRVLSERAEAHRRTVVTSNAQGEELRQRYGEALIDRLRVLAIIPDLSKCQSLRTRPARGDFS